MQRRSRQHYTAGITLIELMVVVGIVAVVSSVIMFNYGRFTTNVSIRNLAQDVALAIRKAQSYATSVQSLPNTTITAPAYGVAFSLADPSANKYAPSKKQLIIFADVNGDGAYNYDPTNPTCGTPTLGNECVEAITITTSDTIAQICSDTITGVNNCSSNSAQGVILEFCRPAPDAVIYTNNNGLPGCAPSIPASSYGEIVVQSQAGVTQHIRLWNTGQISVQ